ncbi:MAG TPA: phosphoserine phosphatase SerB [Stellaceae bacterium]|nr:phosphoserine phosphatase SerB [Stellaceae bacterium]
MATDHTLTLICDPAGPGLDEARVDDVRDALHRLGATLEPVVWLAERIACDLPFSDLHADQASAAARSALGEAPIDCVAQPNRGRRKRLLVADMESTLIRNEMLDELGDFVGLRTEIAEITARAMNDELDFVEALVARVALLQGLGVETLAMAAERIEIMPGARELVATMRADGASVVMISGGFRFFTRRVAAELGIEWEIANELAVVDGRLTGRIVPPIVTRQTKYDTLIQQAAALRLPLDATLAVGDGANDLDMLAAAGLGIAFRAKPSVAIRAHHRIDHGDLTALLYAQGYKAGDFVTG